MFQQSLVFMQLDNAVTYVGNGTFLKHETVFEVLRQISFFEVLDLMKTKCY